MKHNNKILFADDDFKYSLLIKDFLTNNGYEVTYVGNGRMALEQFEEIEPDLILLDINMPEKNGFEVAQEIREKNNKVIIFFLTDRSDKTDRLKGFKLKANDYLAKPFYPEELLARIEERLGNSEFSTAKSYKIGNTTFNYGTNELISGNIKVVITSRQAEILSILIESINETVSREQILTQIWGNDNYANSLALNVQISYLRKALHHDKTINIKSVVRKGYILAVKK